MRASWKNRSRLLKIIDIVFLIWLVILVIFLIFARHQPTFYDALSKTDVTNQYSLVVPVQRYILEPIVDISLLTMTSSGLILIPFLLAYIFGRIGIQVMDIKAKEDRFTHHPYIMAIRKSFDFLFVCIFITFPVGTLILFLVYYSTGGFLGLINHALSWVVALFWIDLFLFIGKLGFSWWRISHPKISQKLQKSKKKRWDPIQWTGAKKNIYKIAREIKYFLSFIILLGLCMMCIVCSPIPGKRIQTNLAEGELLLDFHTHTTRSDGFTTPEAKVLWYMQQGISGAAFSDHHNTEGSKQAQAFVKQYNLNFIVFTASEFTDNTNGRVHLNYYGIDDALTPLSFFDFLPLWVNQSSPNPMNITNMIKYVKAHGGFVTVNHYGDNASRPIKYESFRDWGIDGFEIVTGDHINSGELRQFCIANNLACISGSDDAMNSEIDSFTRLKLDDPNNKTLAAIFTALKKNQHQTVLIHRNPARVNVGISDINTILNYFLGMTYGQILAWIAWTIALYCLSQKIFQKARIIEKRKTDVIKEVKQQI